MSYANQGISKKKTLKKKNVTRLLIYLLKIVVAVVMFTPIIWIISGSFKTLTEFTTSAKIIPENFILDNYKYVFSTGSFFKYFKNTLLLILGTSIGTLLSSSLVSYPLARMEFPGKNLFFGIIVGTMLVPEISLIIPKYIMFGKIGWLDSLLPMIIPAFFAFPYNVFLFRQFLRSIPKELDEAAIIDGCSHVGLFFRVIAPLSKPIYITIGILSSVYWWNELTQPVFFLNSDTWRTLTIALMTTFTYVRGDAFVVSWPTVMAAASLMILPPMLLYLFGSKYLVEGIKTSGIKG